MTRFGAMFMWHFRRERFRMLGLGLAAALFVALVLAISNSVRPAEVQELFEKLPPMVRGMIGLKAGEMFDMARWVGVIFTHPVFLIAILVFPLAAGLRGISGGVDDGSLEVVLAQPISRTTYYTSLAAVVGVGVTVVLTCSLLGSLLVRALIDLPGELLTSTLVQLTVSAWALAFAVGGIALLASAAGAGGGRPGSWAIGSVVAMFFFQFLSTVLPDFAWLRWLSIFGYHAPREVVRDGLAPGLTLALIAVGIACAGAGLVAFRRKQLTF